MKKILLILMLCGGCSTVGFIADRASQANDEALKSAEFTICVAASVGAIERRYNTKSLVKARKELCKRDRVIIND
jgi:hypothetical protein